MLVKAHAASNWRNLGRNGKREVGMEGRGWREVEIRARVEGERCEC